MRLLWYVQANRQYYCSFLSSHRQPEIAHPDGENPILASLSPPTPGQSTLVNSAAGAAGALAGWAISSIGRKVSESDTSCRTVTKHSVLQLTTGDLQSNMNAAPQAAASDLNRPTSAPAETASNGLGRPQAFSSSSAALSTPNIKPKPSSTKGMHLGASKVPAHVTADWAEEAAAEAEAEESSHANPWGNDDLMDVNADQDDWSEYLGGIGLQQTLMSFAGAFESEAIENF